MEIYIIICRNKTFNDFTSVAVSQECYDTKEKAVEFCMSRLNEEERKQHIKYLERDLINWYEFESSRTVYEIKVLKVV